jgi:hypothetical protein
VALLCCCYAVVTSAMGFVTVDIDNNNNNSVNRIVRDDPSGFHPHSADFFVPDNRNYEVTSFARVYEEDLFVGGSTAGQWQTRVLSIPPMAARSSYPRFPILWRRSSFTMAALFHLSYGNNQQSTSWCKYLIFLFFPSTSTLFDISYMF